MPELGATSLNAALKQENAELRARVAELEAEVKRQTIIRKCYRCRNVIQDTAPICACDPRQ